MSVANYLSNPVSRTLIIPLIIKAKESERPDGLFTDPAAQRAVADLPEGVRSISINTFMRIGTAIRVHYFDGLTRNFLNTRENPVIVNLGCGLDTRFTRTDSEKGIHVNLDLPDVMALRKKILLEPGERCIDWMGSILDRDWMDKLETEYADSSFMFIAEGVLMFLEEEHVRKLVCDIAERFPDSRLAFDTVGGSVFKKINRKSAVKQLTSSLLWSYDDDGSIDGWHGRLRRLECACYFNRFRTRWGIWSLMHHTPWGNGSLMHHFSVDA